MNVSSSLRPFFRRSREIATPTSSIGCGIRPTARKTGSEVPVAGGEPTPSSRLMPSEEPSGLGTRCIFDAQCIRVDVLLCTPVMRCRRGSAPDRRSVYAESEPRTSRGIAPRTVVADSRAFF